MGLVAAGGGPRTRREGGFRLDLRPGNVHCGHHSFKRLLELGWRAMVLLRFPDSVAKFAQPF